MDYPSFYHEIATRLERPCDNDLILLIQGACITEDEWFRDPYDCLNRVRGAEEETYSPDWDDVRIEDYG